MSSLLLVAGWNVTDLTGPRPTEPLCGNKWASFQKKKKIYLPTFFAQGKISQPATEPEEMYCSRLKVVLTLYLRKKEPGPRLRCGKRPSISRRVSQCRVFSRRHFS